VRVRFKRFGAATKAFIERAVNAKNGNAQPARPSSPEAERPSAPEAAPPSQNGDRLRLVDGDRSSMPEVRLSMTELEPAFAEPAPSARADREPSGLRQRAPGPVTAPANREELLQRLRQRRHSA
jgi:hypothetical protein